ncbi:hypothetical protein KQX54_020506 [Cotesia glomerata]|uniref:Uncharacterized protein n=1 Tax=Cotesia glomerata TaxID=32391 RepID=A0AAV7J8D4_COTGL|nr:hypothetical protein KQX54_020506 [Cotesia glomerata]
MRKGIKIAHIGKGVVMVITKERNSEIAEAAFESVVFTSLIPVHFIHVVSLFWYLESENKAESNGKIIDDVAWGAIDGRGDSKDTQEHCNSYYCTIVHCYATFMRD